MKPALAAACAFLLCIGAAAALEVFEKSELTIVSAQGRNTFQVDVAKTARQQAQGLMFRRRLAPDAGMLFPYPSPRKVSFWMKNTLIPLDLLFVAADGRIVNIHQRAAPQSLSPIQSQGPVLAVIELNGGTADRLDIRPGDRVEHEIFAK